MGAQRFKLDVANSVVRLQLLIPLGAYAPVASHAAPGGTRGCNWPHARCRKTTRRWAPWTPPPSSTASLPPPRPRPPPSPSPPPEAPPARRGAAAAARRLTVRLSRRRGWKARGGGKRAVCPGRTSLRRSTRFVRTSLLFLLPLFVASALIPHCTAPRNDSAVFWGLGVREVAVFNPNRSPC